jgi:hypothetical protein
MRAVSAAFLATVAASHVVVTRADLWFNGRCVFPDLAVVSGQLRLDDDDAIRGNLSQLVIADPLGELVPAVGRATGLHTYGTLIHLRGGVVVPGGAAELVSLGWYAPQDVQVAESYRRTADGTGWISGGAAITVDASDRMAAVQDYRFLAPASPPAGARCLAEIKRLCAGLLPIGAWPNLTDPLVPAGTAYTESRLDAVASLATAANVRAYADPDGALMIRPITEPTRTPVAVLSTTDAVSAIATRYTRDGVYNAVVARGENTATGEPVQAVAYDTDPASPTRWDGPFGRVPMFYTSPLLATPAACAAAASTLLASIVRGRDRIEEFDAAPNPALEPGDVVQVNTPRAGFIGPLVSITLPLAAATGPASYRVRVGVGGDITTDDGT